MARDPRTVYPVASPRANATELRWPDKAPAEIVRASLNAAGWLEVGDSIVGSSITATVSPDAAGDLLLALQGCDGTTISWLMSAGQLPSGNGPLTDYDVLVTFTTSFGRVFSEQVWCLVAPLSKNDGYAPYVSVVVGPTGPGGNFSGAFAVQNNNRDLVLYAASGNVTFTGLVPALSLAIGNLIYAQTTKPAQVGAPWNSGGIVEVSDGNS